MQLIWRIALIPLSMKMAVSAHQAYFGCPVRFGAQRSCLHLERTSLDQQLAEYHSKLSFIDTVSWLLKHLLSERCPDIPAVASELGVSECTLQRRLTEEVTNFQRLFATARRSRSYELLADPSLELMKVALLLGYKEQSSFFRTFKL